MGGLSSGAVTGSPGNTPSLCVGKCTHTCWHAFILVMFQDTNIYAGYGISRGVEWLVCGELVQEREGKRFLCSAPSFFFQSAHAPRGKGYKINWCLPGDQANMSKRY